MSKEESGSGTAGIYANFPEVNVADMIYVFANAYGKDEETGTYLYRYNGRSQTPTIRATARVASSGGDGTEEGGTTDINATNDLIFEVAENDGSAGDVSVKVTSNSYHYTGETELTFRIVPFDLSDQDAGNRWEAEFTVENAEYSSDNPAGTTYEPAVTGRVRLGVVNWSNLVQADDETSEGDFVVTYENNDRVGEATAVITGVNNYTGTVRVNFQIEKTDEVARGADGNWYYYKNGVVQSDYTGFQENSNGWWYIEGGKVTFAKNDVIHGTVNGQDGWWYVRGSQVIFTDTVAQNSNGWWRIENGKVNFSANTVAQNSNGWWYIRDGKVNFAFNGIAQNSNGWWYIRDGQVDFGYNGTVTADGRTYTVVNGRASR